MSSDKPAKNWKQSTSFSNFRTASETNQNHNQPLESDDEKTLQIENPTLEASGKRKENLKGHQMFLKKTSKLSNDSEDFSEYSEKPSALKVGKSSSASPRPKDYELEENKDLQILIDRISHYYDAHHYHHSSSPGVNAPRIDRRRAFYLMEAAAGNVDLAVNLYWDDFVASSSNLSANTNVKPRRDSNENEEGAAVYKRQKINHNSSNNAYKAYKSVPSKDLTKASKGESIPESTSLRAHFFNAFNESENNSGQDWTLKKSQKNSHQEATTPTSKRKATESDETTTALHKIYAARRLNTSETKPDRSNTSEGNASSPDNANPLSSSDFLNDHTERRTGKKTTGDPLAHPPPEKYAFIPRRLPLRRLFPDIPNADDTQDLEQDESENNSNDNQNSHSNPHDHAPTEPNLQQQLRQLGAGLASASTSQQEGAPPGVARSRQRSNADLENEEENAEENEEVDANQNSVSISDDEAAATARFCKIFSIDDDDNPELDEEDAGDDKERRLRNKRGKRKHQSVANLRKLRVKRMLKNKLKKARDDQRKRGKEGLDVNETDYATEGGDDETILKDPPETNEDADDISDTDSNFSVEDISSFISFSPSSVIWGKPSRSESKNEETLPSIPPCWINAFFSLSPSRNGLNVQVDDKSESNQKILSSQCGGFTALASLVTALIQSGASIQGKKVSCGKSRTRFSDLTKIEKARQFQSRLADALSSLLFIAANSSSAYHKAAAERRKKRMERKGGKFKFTMDEEKIIQKAYQRDLKLCSVCKWQDSPTEPRRARVGEAISTSLTNILDLRLYVLSQLEAFMSPGGCALFLETIVKMHGARRIRRMLKTSSGKESLLACDCDSREIPKGKSKIEWLDHLGNGCMSVELLSLLITGEIHASYEGWDSGGLGIGILGMKTSPIIGEKLMYPSTPVWIVRGKKCFSTMWLEDRKDIKYLNSSGSAFKLVHWNCWGSGRKTVLKIITSRNSFSEISSLDREAAFELDANNLQKERIDQISHDVEDERYYPNQYVRWRFDLAESGHDDVKERGSIDNEGKSVSKKWIPYFRLDQKQKLMVDFKYAPSINMVIWSRWKKAIVTQCTSTNAPVV